MAVRRATGLCLLSVTFFWTVVLSQLLTELRNPPANWTGDVNIEDLVIAWEKRETEIEAFYERYPDGTQEPDPHSVAHLHFEELRQAAEESDHDFNHTLSNLESHHLTCRKDWLKRKASKRTQLNIAKKLKVEGVLPGVAENRSGQRDATGSWTRPRSKRQTDDSEERKTPLFFVTEHLRNHTLGLMLEIHNIINGTLKEVSDRALESLAIALLQSSTTTTTSQPTSSSTTSVFPSTTPKKTTKSTPTTQVTTQVPSLTPTTQETTKVPSLTPTTQKTTQVLSLTPTTQETTQVPSLTPTTQETTKVPSLTPTTQKSTQNPSLTPTTQETTQVPSLTPTTQETTQVPFLTPTTQETTQVPSLTPTTQETTKVPSLTTTTPPQETTKFPSLTTMPTTKYTNLCQPHAFNRKKRSITNTLLFGTPMNNTLNLKEKLPPKPLLRTKRLVITDESREWPYGIVPYVYSWELTVTEERGIQQAMATYEKLTCMRFVSWQNNSGVTTNDLLNLGHQSYLRFISGSEGCYSYVGKLDFPEGQEIACYCGRTSCLHELGHAFGFKHEHSSPERDDWVTVHKEDIPWDRFFNYEKFTPEEVVTYGYDLYSVMHYPVGRNLPYITLNDKDLSESHRRDSHHYMFSELEKTQKCQGKSCRDAKINCQNDGYVSYVDGQCTCVCPRGLDPQTGCTTIRRPGDVSPQLPKGNYALPSPADGCPHAKLRIGIRRHAGGGYNSVKNYHLAGTVTSQMAEHVTCTNDGSVGDAETEWSIGSYCIYRRGGTCPPNFRYGYIKYSDRYSSQYTTIGGVLPDGSYRTTSTLFYFCCREDGFASEEIFLPNQAPLALFKFGDSCQQIFGMRSTVGTLKYRNYITYTLSARTYGDNPLTTLSDYYYYYVDHCYYTPVNMSCGGIIHLTPENDSVTLTSDGGKNLLCHWLITVPQDDNILLTFDDLNLRTVGDTKECLDALEVRFIRIGSPGLILCGETDIRSVKSYENKLMLTFNTSGDSDSSFTTTARILPNSKSCYLKSDRGQSYGGFVNFTRKAVPCLSWSQVGHCQHHRLSLRDMTSNLEGNYCRNPDSGLAPWCYTNAEDCERDYCDVCFDEPRVDYYSDCQERQASGYCWKYPAVAVLHCALTCGDLFRESESPVPVNTVSCLPPIPPSDGEMMSSTKAAYSVGEKVTFKCKDSTITVQTVCLTTGRWSEITTACLACQDEWVEHNGYCYGYIPQKVTFEMARSICSTSYGGTVATAKDEEELLTVDFVRDQMGFEESVWLGISDAEVEGQWRWLDNGLLATWTNWGTDEPDDFAAFNSDCAMMYRNSYWYDFSCDEEFATVCKVKANAVPCVDVWEDCDTMYYDQPKMCKEHPEVARSKCRFTCGFCQSNTCTVEQPSDNALVIPSSLTIYRGEYVSYSCNYGYIPLSNKHFRGCQWCGAMTGEPFTCVSQYDVLAPMPFPRLSNKKWLSSVDIVLTGNNDNFRIRRAGRIVAWEYESLESRDMAFTVWTPIPSELGGVKFKFKGANSLRTRSHIMTTHYVPKSEIISVYPGDVIGIYYGPGQGGVPLENCDSFWEGSAGNVYYLRQPNYLPFTPGIIYTFSSNRICRLFAFRGLLEP